MPDGCVLGLCRLDHPRHITGAFGTTTNQQQVATRDGAAEIGDRHFMAAVGTPDIGQQALPGVGWDGLPTLTGRWGEVWD